MVLLYDPAGTHSAHWARSVPTGSEAAVVSDLQAFAAAVARANGVVAFIPDTWERDRGVVARLRTLRASHPLKFLIAVRPTAEAVPLPIEADVTLTVEQARELLWPMVRALEDRGLHQRLADVIRSSGEIPPQLRLALLHILLRPVPPSSLKELAAEMGCDRRTLPRAWDAMFGSKHGRLVDFLDWIVLLHAIGRKSAKRSWVAVARDVALSEETLTRSARKLLDLSLSEFGRLGQPAVLTRFRPVFEQLFGQWPEPLPLDVPMQRQPHHILVVDDHEAILQFLNYSLQRAGFKVDTAASGGEALLHLRQESELPRAVLSDVRMAGMDGLELARRITREWPSLPVVLMSAFVSSDMVQREWQRGQTGYAVQFLAKPFSAGRVAALLRQICEGLS